MEEFIRLLQDFHRGPAEAWQAELQLGMENIRRKLNSSFFTSKILSNSPLDGWPSVDSLKAIDSDDDFCDFCRITLAHPSYPSWRGMPSVEKELGDLRGAVDSYIHRLRLVESELSDLTRRANQGSRMKYGLERWRRLRRIRSILRMLLTTRDCMDKLRYEEKCDGDETNVAPIVEGLLIPLEWAAQLSPLLESGKFPRQFSGLMAQVRLAMWFLNGGARIVLCAIAVGKAILQRHLAKMPNLATEDRSKRYACVRFNITKKEEKEIFYIFWFFGFSTFPLALQVSQLLTNGGDNSDIVKVVAKPLLQGIGMFSY